MDLSKFTANKNEKPLDNMAVNGGFCGIFRKNPIFKSMQLKFL